MLCNNAIQCFYRSTIHNSDQRHYSFFGRHDTPCNSKLFSSVYVPYIISGSRIYPRVWHFATPLSSCGTDLVLQLLVYFCRELRPFIITICTPVKTPRSPKLGFRRSNQYCPPAPKKCFSCFSLNSCNTKQISDNLSF